MPKLTTSRSVLVARVLLLLGAVALAAAGVLVALRDESAALTATDGFVCPMHPEVFSTTPGQCPICKMALEPIEKSKGHAPAPSVVHPPDCPMHRKGAPAVEKPKAEVPVVPALALQAGSDTNPNFASGVTWLPETHPPAATAKASDRPILDTPKRRVFVDDVRAPAWLETPERLVAVLYRDELVGLSRGEPGRFFRSGSPRVAIDVRLSDEPLAPWDASTSLVRFVVEPRAAESPSGDFAASHADVPPGAASAPRSGDVGWLEIDDKSRELLVFPESALLRSNEGPHVLVAGPSDGTFARRSLQIGRILKGHVVVLSGLREDERIVVSNAFFLDPDRSREPRSEPIAGALP